MVVKKQRHRAEEAIIELTSSWKLEEADMKVCGAVVHRSCCSALVSGRRDEVIKRQETAPVNS